MDHHTDLHEPVQQDCSHLGLQMGMLLQHVDIPGVGPVLLQHVVPDHILTRPAVKYRGGGEYSSHLAKKKKIIINRSNCKRKNCERKHDLRLDQLASQVKKRSKTELFFF